MPGAEINLVNSKFVNGVLRFQNYRVEDVFEMGATTGVPFGAHYQTNTTMAAATSLTTAMCGKRVLCSTDAVVYTLPTAAVAGVNFLVTNTASDGGALIVVKTAATTDVIMGNGANATTNCAILNTKATQRFGDSIGLMSSGSVTWFCTNVVGTWANAATS